MQQTNGTCKYIYKSHDTVQVMQAQYPSLQSENIKKKKKDGTGTMDLPTGTWQRKQEVCT